MSDSPTLRKSTQINKEQRTRSVTFRLTPSEYAAFEKQVTENGQTITSEIRRLIKIRITGIHSPSQREIDKVFSLAPGLNQAGNNLNQVARRLNMGKQVSERDLVTTIAKIQIETVKLKRAIIDLTKAYRRPLRLESNEA